VAVHLFEDLHALGKSPKFCARVNANDCVVNVGNKAHGVAARRGDGTFGELIPGQIAEQSSGFVVGRGLIATIEIGVECKVLAKAMIKQIDRVMTDLKSQAAQFSKGTGSQPITVALVGVNHADYAIGYEGDRANRTGRTETINPLTGKKRIKNDKHPKDEASAAVERLNAEVRRHYDEMILLRYKATNDEPFLFEWVDLDATTRDYSAALTKISRAYEQRF
jgi:hypothetical protein